MTPAISRALTPFIATSLFLAGSGCGDLPEALPEDPRTEAALQEEQRGRASPWRLAVTPLGTYATGVFDQGAAEIGAYDPATQRVFSVNAGGGVVDVIDLRDPSAPVLAASLQTAGAPNSVAVSGGAVAVASTAGTRTDDGFVQFFDTVSGTLLKTLTVGAVPDMVVFTPDGRFLLVANEGEPSDDYTIDPEGSVSVIDVSRGVHALTQASVRTARFDASVPLVNRRSLRVFGPGASPAQDFEPEYIAVSPDSRTAWVTLQENNALAVLDIRAAAFTRVIGLGFKNHALRGNELDPSDRDGAIDIARWPVFGMYLPDAIASFQSRGRTYLVTANEGDARDYDGFSEEARVKDLVLDETAFPGFPSLQADAALGRLTVTTTLGDSNGDGRYERLFAFGGRSLSIWDSDGEQVWDSGSALERITARVSPADFNSDNTETGSFDARSDNKGPEPEGVVVARLFGRQYAFVALERIGGLVVYEVSEPRRPRFVTYFNNRDFSAHDPAEAGDLGPEGVLVIEAEDSPNGRPLLVVSNEVSGTTTVSQLSLAR